VDPISLILLVLCIVLVAAMWAALVSADQLAERVRVRTRSEAE
jgi:hypothetical protein